MTRPSSSHLLDMLAEVPDPRHKKGPAVSLSTCSQFDRHRTNDRTQRVYLHSDLGATST